MNSANRLETATLGGGCFWCLEAVFDNLQGVEDVVSGYTGGHTVEPNYEQVCTGKTGHTEVVKVTFDPTIISYQEILEVFFAVHDPTTLNRQGEDVGTQYRSVIYYHSPAQKEAAEKVIAELKEAGYWEKPIVTEVTAAPVFYAAEDYHQEFFKSNPTQGYCAGVVGPKVTKFRQKFLSKLKPLASTVLG